MSALSFCLFVSLVIAANALYKDEPYDGDFSFGQYGNPLESDMYWDYLFGEAAPYHGKPAGRRYPVPPRPYRWPLGGAYPLYPPAAKATYAPTTAAPTTVASTTVASTTETPEITTTEESTTVEPTTVDSTTAESTTAASISETTPRPISMILNGPRMQVILTV